MRSTKLSPILVLFLGVLSGQAAPAHDFGSEPLDDVYYAAQNYNFAGPNYDCPSPLSTDKLVAYMLTPTWWEVTGADATQTPSPMTLSRGDNNTAFYPPGQRGTNSPHRRAFWHPGIGAWQLDDVNDGSNLSLGKFNTREAAIQVAIKMSTNYCRAPTAYSVFGPWCACGSDGTCGAPDRSRCEGTFNRIYNPNGPPEHPIERDPSTGQLGGSQVRTCRFAGQTATFICLYVNPANAEGYTGEADGTPYGWISYPDAPTAPLAKPFYVYKEESGGISYEWRYWMNSDTGYGIDYAVRRRYGNNSRDGMFWIANADETAQALCDVTMSRGVCSLSCTIPLSTSGATAEATCVPPPQIPTVTTNSATNVTQQSATLNLSVNPGGAATTIWFDWGPSAAFGQETTRRDIGSGTSTLPASISLGQLSCDTTYYFRARAQNSAGSAAPGQTLSFRTDSCGGGGSTTQELITNGGFESGYTGWIAQNSFYIDAQSCPYSGSRYAFMSHPNGTWGDGLFGILDQVFTIPASATSATLSYRYSISTNDPSTSPQDVMTVWIYNSSGTSSLELLTSYSNRNAQNGCGSSYYTRDSFDVSQYKGESIRVRFLATTDSRSGTPTVFRVDTVSVLATVLQASAPTVTTDSADQISPSSARLNMTVDPNDADTTVWFNLEAGDSTPDDETERIVIGAGSQSKSVSISAFALQCATLYYYRARASNSVGSDSGSVRSFTTSACPGGPPNADTDPAENITQTSATLTADVDPNGLSTQAWFAWGESPGLGQETPHSSVGSGTGNVDFSQILSGLACDTTYYFENHAENSAGHDDGATLSFTTDSCDPVNLPVVTVTTTDPEATEQSLTNGEFLIQRSGSTAIDLVVTYSVGGTAIPGQDHTLAGGSVVIPAGSSGRTLTVSPLDDQAAEADETVVVTLQAQAQYQVGEPSSATVMIVSDDVQSGPGGCGRILVQQPRDEFGGCDASDAGIQWWVAENFKLSDRSKVSCLEVLGYYWPNNDPPSSSVFDVVIYEVANDGAPGTVIHENRGIQAQRQKTGTVSFGLEEWRFTIELPNPVELAAGDFFAEISGAATAGGSFCWIGGQKDPVAGLNGLAFRNTGQWSLGTWDLAFKVFEVEEEIFVDGFETGDLSKWLVTPSSSSPVTRHLTQGQPGEPGKDIWTTSIFSYAPGGGGPGGGLDDDRLRVGGWADSYHSLIEFDLTGLPQHAQSARIELFSRPQNMGTALYLDRITESWDWRTQGTGSDRERLWWADRPDAVQWTPDALPAPTPGQWYSIDITDLYNAWQAGTYPNHGVQLRPASTNNTWSEFYSANSADQTLRPRLVVEP